MNNLYVEKKRLMEKLIQMYEQYELLDEPAKEVDDTFMEYIKEVEYRLSCLL